MPVTEFIQGAGGSVVSNNVMSGVGELKWAVREPSQNPADNGWRFLADIDDDAYLADSRNLTVRDFNAIAEVEPAVLGIWALPVGSDLQLVVEDGRRVWYDNATERPLEL